MRIDGSLSKINRVKDETLSFTPDCLYLVIFFAGTADATSTYTKGENKYQHPLFPLNAFINNAFGYFQAFFRKLSQF